MIIQSHSLRESTLRQVDAMQAKQPRAMETLRVRNRRVRALYLHMRRLKSSWKLLAQANAVSSPSELMLDQLDQRIQAELTLRGYHYGKQPDFIANSCVTQDEVLRIWLSLSGELTLQTSTLDPKYISIPRTVATVYLSDPHHLPRTAKHDQREHWNRAAHAHQVDEVLLADSQGFQWEAHCSNLWAFDLSTWRTSLQVNFDQYTLPLKGTRWLTPPLEGLCLPGITRELLLVQLRNWGAHVIETPLKLPLTTLTDTEEHEWVYYLSSSLKTLSWIDKLDGVPQPERQFNTQLLSFIDQVICTL